MADPQPPSGNKKSWRDAPTAPTATPAVAKRRSIFRVAAMIMVLLGVILGILWAITPHPRALFVPIVITEYDDPHLPVLAQAHRDHKALVDSGFFELVKNYQTDQELHEIKDVLRNLADQKDKPVVVYLCAHALCTDKGNLCLLPGKAEIDKPETWLPFVDVLQYLRECPAPHKLLILDIMRPLADPRRGVVSDDVAWRAHKAVKENADDKLLVLCACSPGEVSLTSEELRHSVFGYYVMEGLRGWADGCLDGKPNQRVTVRELEKFLRARVARWARENRGAEQTPVLWGSAEDFELAKVDEDRLKTSEPAPAESETAKAAEGKEAAPAEGKADKASAPPQPVLAAGRYPDWLRNAWLQREQWATDQAVRDDPESLRQLGDELLRLEHRWQGGTRADEILKDAVARKLEEFNQKAERARQSLRQPEHPRSLALAFALAPKPSLDKKPSPEAKTPPDKKPPSLPEALDDLLEKRNREKPDDLKTARKEFYEQIKDKPARDLAHEIFKRIRDNPQPEAIRFLYGLFRDRWAPDSFGETLFLHRLDGLAARIDKARQENKETEAWPKEEVRLALEVVLAGEKAAACVSESDGVWTWDPRAFPWIQAALKDAAQLRHAGEMLLFASGYAEPQDSQRFLKDASQKYAKINDAVEQMHDAYRIQDRAAVQLPGLASYLISPAGIDDPSLWNDWEDAIQRLQGLQELLAHPPKEAKAAAAPDAVDARIKQIKRQTDSLRDALAKVTDPFSDEKIKEAIRKAKQFKDDPKAVKNLINLFAMLEIPWLKATDREFIWNAVRTQAQALHDKTRAEDQSENERHAQTAAVPPGEEETALRRESLRAAWRARLALTLLKLGGQADLKELEEKLAQARNEQPAQPATWPALAHRIQKTWSDSANQLLSKEGSQKETVAQTEVLWQWLADHYRYEQKDLEGWTEGSDRVTDGLKKIAEEYKDLVTTKPLPAVWLEKVSCEPNHLDLLEEKREGRCTLRYELRGGSSAPSVTPEILANRFWFQQPVFDWKEVQQGKYELAVPIQLKPDAEKSPGPAPAGMLIRTRVNGRTFHHKVATLVRPPVRDSLQLIISQKKEQPTPDLIGDELRLRPNQQQTFYVHVKNPGTQKKEAKVELRANSIKGGFVQETVSVNANAFTLVKFKGLTVPTADEKKKEALQELPVLTGPVQVRVVDAKDDKVEYDKKEFRVVVKDPQDLVQVRQIYYDPKEKSLVARVEPREPITGDKCTVRLVIPEDPNPGLFWKGEGKTGGNLLPEQKVLVLTAENLKFTEDTSAEELIVYLTVDNCDRAFIYRIHLGSSQGGPTLGLRDPTPAFRLLGPKAILPDEDYRALVEVDNVGRNVQFEVSKDATKMGKFELEWPRPQQPRGDRERKVRFSPVGTEGDLVFQTSVKDWVFRVKTDGIRGEWKLRVRLLNKEMNDIFPAKEKTIQSDDSPPDNVHFLSVNATKVPERQPAALEVPKADAVVVKVEGRDEQSDIHQVLFFTGEPVDGKEPPGAKLIPAEPINAAKTVWRQKVPLPPDKEGVSITVKFINGVGKFTFATLPLKLKTPEEVKYGRVEGTVAIGDRKPSDLTVVLTDQAGKARRTKTEKGGKFVFDKVDPGTYTVSCQDDNRSAAQQVPVEVGKTASVDLDLKVR
jgi:hypothetical protein